MNRIIKQFLKNITAQHCYTFDDGNVKEQYNQLESIPLCLDSNQYEQLIAWLKESQENPSLQSKSLLFYPVVDETKPGGSMNIAPP